MEPLLVILFILLICGAFVLFGPFASRENSKSSKKTPPTQKHNLILKAYLSSSMPMVSADHLSNPPVRLGIQVFILGMTDMCRQAQKLSWEQFIAVYEETLLEHKLLPTMPVKDFVERIEERVSSNGDVAKVMRYGAQSIQMYIAEQDANAPTDLLSAAVFAEKNAGSFTQI